MLKYIGGSSDASAMEEICSSMDELCLHNQTLEDNIQERQQETSPLEKMKVLDP